MCVITFIIKLKIVVRINVSTPHPLRTSHRYTTGKLIREGSRYLALSRKGWNSVYNLLKRLCYRVIGWNWFLCQCLFDSANKELFVSGSTTMNSINVGDVTISDYSALDFYWVDENTISNIIRTKDSNGFSLNVASCWRVFFVNNSVRVWRWRAQIQAFA